MNAQVYIHTFIYMYVCEKNVKKTLYCFCIVLNHRAMTQPSKRYWHQLSGITHWLEQQVDSGQELFSTGLLTPGICIYHFCIKETWEHVSVHWQHGKYQLWANCFMRWMPVLNQGFQNFRDTPHSFPHTTLWNRILRQSFFIRKTTWMMTKLGCKSLISYHIDQFEKYKHSAYKS